MVIGVTPTVGPGQADLVAHLTSFALALQIGNVALASVAGGDDLKKPRRLVACLGAVSQGKQGSATPVLEVTGVSGVAAVNSKALFESQIGQFGGRSCSRSRVPQSAVPRPSPPSTSLEPTISGTGTSLLSNGLGDVWFEHDQLGRHVYIEVKEKIWNGMYLDILELLVARPKEEETKSCTECSHSRDSSHWPYKKRMEETLVNCMKVISIFQGIMAECSTNLSAQLTCYQNRIVCAHDEHGGPAWKEYDRRIRATRPTLA
ncbi:hypothetical protein NDU88_005426 [Pleurodeles waltl]|uniref:Uncharacterized protein n=1 Tax=Pleurodeles waltl TaxID=8319 RepID=A0AAV7LXA2_PLEWA|nr:hypothetical protein NDU88_005426 [Pleurodeles waltl]